MASPGRRCQPPSCSQHCTEWGPQHWGCPWQAGGTARPRVHPQMASHLCERLSFQQMPERSTSPGEGGSVSDAAWAMPVVPGGCAGAPQRLCSATCQCCMCCCRLPALKPNLKRPRREQQTLKWRAAWGSSTRRATHSGLRFSSSSTSPRSLWGPGASMLGNPRLHNSSREGSSAKVCRQLARLLTAQSTGPHSLAEHRPVLA